MTASTPTAAALAALLFTTAIVSPARGQDPAARLGSAFDRVFAKDATAVCLVAVGERVVFERGPAGAPSGGDAAAEIARFDAGALTETWTAAAVLRLQQSGKLRIDDSFSVQLANVPTMYAPLSLRNLLMHTSALPVQLDFAPEDLTTRSVFLRRVFAEAYYGRPGRFARVSDLDYPLAAAIVEAVAGEAFEDVVRREVFAVAGLQDTDFASARPESIGAASPEGWLAKGRSGVSTSLRDLMRWSAALQRGDVLQQDGLRQLFEAFYDGQALGWRVALDEDRALASIEAGGVSVRGGTYLRLVVPHEVLVVLHTDATTEAEASPVDLAAVATELAELAVPQWEGAARDEVLGRYRLGDGSELDVVARGDALQLRAFGPEAAAWLWHGEPGAEPAAQLGERAEALMQQVLEPKDDGDASPGAAVAAARALVESLVAAHGAAREVRLLGSRLAPESSWLRVTFGETSVTLRVDWQEEQLGQLVPDPDDPLLVDLVEADRVFRAATRDGRAWLRLTFERGERSAPAALRLFGPGDRGRRGLRCPRR
ncbi:MAG: serine hydrolase domain-containing protein [Planctomycetota bacterium]